MNQKERIKFYLGENLINLNFNLKDFLNNLTLQI